jgi:virginiamycin A acetyltransferase
MRQIIKKTIVNFVDVIIKKIIAFIYGANSSVYKLFLNNVHLRIKEEFVNSTSGNNVKLYPPYRIVNSEIGNYTYIAENSILHNTNVGKFCSIGPNLLCGWGIHPTNGLSTHPMFYSTKKQNGISLSDIDKVEETKRIYIGNDVFIGMNVSILDGVKIGDGAVIGAGALVSKDIPAYAVAVGNPIKIIKYRFDESTIEQLLQIKWWEFKHEDLHLIEKHFFEVDEFVKKQK